MFCGGMLMFCHGVSMRTRGIRTLAKLMQNLSVGFIGPHNATAPVTPHASFPAGVFEKQIAIAPVEPHAIFPAGVSEIQIAIAPCIHSSFPAGVFETQNATVPVERHASFPAVVFEEDVLSRNVVEGATGGVNSQHRPANQGGEGESGYAPEHLLEVFDLSGQSLILLF